MAPVLAFDPREQQPEQDQTPQYLTFRQHSQASEHLSVLADMLRHVVMLFDGNLHEPPQTIEPRFLKAAELAIRYCSEESRISAERAAEEYAVAKFAEAPAAVAEL